MARTRRVEFALAPTLFLAACASVAEVSREDHDAAGQMIQTRLGVEAASPESDAAVTAMFVERAADGLSSDDAVAIALAANPSLRIRLAELGIASADVVAAQRLPNPVLSASAKFFSGGSEIELSLVQPFLALLSRAANIEAAEATRDRQLAVVAGEGVHLAFEVRRAYLELATEEAALRIAEQRLDVVRKSDGIVESLHGAGNVDDLARAKARVDLSSAELSLAQLQVSAEAAREPLQRMLGLWGGSPRWELASEAPQLTPQGATASAGDSAEFERLALEASLDLQSQRARLEWALRKSDAEVREAVLGDSSLGVVAEREAAGKWGLGPGFQISLPLFDRGSARRSRVDAELEREAQLYRSLELEIRSAARLFQMRAKTLGELARVMEVSHMPALGAVVTEQLHQFNAMQIGVFDVLTAREQELNGRRDWIDAVRDAQLAQLDLQELLAGSLPRNRLDPSMEAKGSGRGAVAGDDSRKEH